MDKNNTERIDFLRSYFSDYVQYQSRSLNAAQPSLGNFSNKTFENVPLTNKTVTLESKRNFRSQSQTQPDPNAFMAQQSQTHWSWGARVFIQMMMLAQEQGVLDYGWHMLGRLHMIEREFNRLKSSDDLWNTNKQTIGFNSYAREEANQITNDDWLLIALSYVNERDMRNYLDMWGFNFTDKAKSQVASLSLTPMPLTFFASSSRGYCVDEFAKAPISVDGVTAWPLN